MNEYENHFDHGIKVTITKKLHLLDIQLNSINKSY